MAPQLRPRTSRIKPETYDDHQHGDTESTSTQSISSSSPLSPPVYTIDLSLPPSERYVRLARVYRLHIQNIRGLFDDVIEERGVHLPRWLIHLLTRSLLHRVYSAEETEELRGISVTADVPMYLLVAYNTFLDMFMGCTSGGVLISIKGNGTRMMHFRTLDWDMPELRKLIVQLHFIQQPGGAVVARSITYVGFVGILTGVKRDLSISLNFRPYHNNDHSLWANVQFRAHQVAVLLGWRPSIASLLRALILPQGGGITANSDATPPSEPTTLDTINTTLPKTPSTAAYLTFCDGHETIILEKDLTTAKILKSSSFIATTNHDAIYDTKDYREHKEAAQTDHSKAHGIGMQEVIDESVERKWYLVRKWTEWSGEQERARDGKTVETRGVLLQELRRWMLEHPVCDEMTHFVCIMDPTRGEIKWARRFEEEEIEEAVR